MGLKCPGGSIVMSPAGLGEVRYAVGDSRDVLLAVGVVQTFSVAELSAENPERWRLVELTREIYAMACTGTLKLSPETKAAVRVLLSERE